MRQQERRALADAATIASGSAKRVSAAAKADTLQSRQLRPDQRAAFKFAIRRSRLAVIEGRAGTGKSFTLAAVREAHERNGQEVIGLAPVRPFTARNPDERICGYGERAGIWRTWRRNSGFQLAVLRRVLILPLARLARTSPSAKRRTMAMLRGPLPLR